MIASEKNYDVLHLVRPFQPEGTKHLARFFICGKTLGEAEEMVIKNILQALPANN